MRPSLLVVIPAKAGIQESRDGRRRVLPLDARLRGHDGLVGYLADTVKLG